MNLIDPLKFGQYMERLDNVCAALERNTEVQEATIQANNQRHDENERRIASLENERKTFRDLFQGGFLTLKWLGFFAVVILIFAAKGAVAGFNWLMGAFGG